MHLTEDTLFQGVVALLVVAWLIRRQLAIKRIGSASANCVSCFPWCLSCSALCRRDRLRPNRSPSRSLLFRSLSAHSWGMFVV